MHSNLDLQKIISQKFQFTLKCKWQTTTSTSTHPRIIYILQVSSLYTKEEKFHHSDCGFSYKDDKSYCHLLQCSLFPIIPTRSKNSIPPKKMSRRRKSLFTKLRVKRRRKIRNLHLSSMTLGKKESNFMCI